MSYISRLGQDSIAQIFNMISGCREAGIEFTLHPFSDPYFKIIYCERMETVEKYLLRKIYPSPPYQTSFILRFKSPFLRLDSF